MANTYSQLYVHFIFSVKDRESLILESFREKLQRYISGIISNNKCKLYAIYANPDHAHLLIGLSPSIAVSNLVRDIKSNSSRYVNEERLSRYRFAWQEGYGAFSHSKSQIDSVIKYIQHQPEHHKKQSFRDEYIQSLKKYAIDYDERYLFDWITF